MNIVSSCVLYEAQTKISVLIYACPKLCDWLVNIWTANQDDLKPGQHKFMLFLLFGKIGPGEKNKYYFHQFNARQEGEEEDDDILAVNKFFTMHEK